MNLFLPSLVHARECRAAMDDALWSSVRDLLAEGLPGAAAPADGPSAGTGLEDPGPASLLDYGAYFDLALAPPPGTTISDEAKAAAASRLARRLPVAAGLGPVAMPPRLSNFSTTDYTPDEIARMRRWWDIEPANDMAMSPASEDDMARARPLIDRTLAYLAEAAPELHGEIETIIRDIVLSRSDGSSTFRFSGASSFALWGALTINMETYYEWTQFLRQIVHEAGHNLLFAIARDQPLVTNDPSDRRASPLRADPRPLDGIYHAAFVSAREAYAFEAMLQHHERQAFLPEGDDQIIADLLELSVLAFWDCIKVLREEAQLTGLGAAVLDDCEAYMTANFAVEPC